jgi:hypothetical protein
VIKIHLARADASFYVHRHVLLKVPFFRVCLHSRCRETQEGTITITGCEDATSYSSICNYLYTGKLEIDSASNCNADAISSAKYLTALARIYAAAHFLMMEELLNELLDMAVEHCKTRVPPKSVLEYLCSNGLEGSELMDHFLLVVTRWIGIARAQGNASTVITHYCYTDGPLAEMLLNVTYDGRTSARDKWKVCKWWHVHAKPKDCGY